jgi:hypothetical protein
MRELHGHHGEHRRHAHDAHASADNLPTRAHDGQVWDAAETADRTVLPALMLRARKHPALLPDEVGSVIGEP